MSDDAKRRKIKQLRALADSTTFPAEAASARAKADKLEAELGGPEPAKPQPSMWATYFDGSVTEEMMRDLARQMQEQQDAYYRDLFSQVFGR